MSKGHVNRETNIHIRAREIDRVLFDEAAQHLGESRSEFLIEGGRERAEKALRDKLVFDVPADKWAAFLAELERAPEDNPSLRDLLNRRAPWEA